MIPNIEAIELSSQFMRHYASDLFCAQVKNGKQIQLIVLLLYELV